jgi:hypothetical protein
MSEMPAGPDKVLVTGIFVRGDGPATGWVHFLPERCWVFHHGYYWATLGPVARLDDNGGFSVFLTPTDADAVLWHYRVYSPAGAYRIAVPYDEVGHTLSHLIKSAA